MNKNMIIITLFALTLLSACTTIKTEDPKICTLEYNPVCGIDGNTYGNVCQAGDIEIQYKGECDSTLHVCTAEEKTNNKCTKEFNPVCGDDDVTYGNDCMACSSNEIDYYKQGSCEKDLKPTNPEAVFCTDEQKVAEICTMEYVPVCGDDGVTYGNKCGACSSGVIDSYVVGECENQVYYCAPKDRNVDACDEIYSPVCATINVQCIKAPCDPIKETFSNNCFACANPLIDEYVEGEC